LLLLLLLFCFFFQYKSQNKSLVFVKIRATLERLCEQASLDKYKLLLDENKVKQMLTQGHYDESRQCYRWKPKLYNSKLLTLAHDDTWKAFNYFCEERAEDSFEYMTIREGDESCEVRSSGTAGATTSTRDWTSRGGGTSTTRTSTAAAAAGGGEEEEEETMVPTGRRSGLRSAARRLPHRSRKVIAKVYPIKGV
jgi:hypothetical protein